MTINDWERAYYSAALEKEPLLKGFISSVISTKNAIDNGAALNPQLDVSALDPAAQRLFLLALAYIWGC